MRNVQTGKIKIEIINDARQRSSKGKNGINTNICFVSVLYRMGNRSTVHRRR